MRAFIEDGWSRCSNPEGDLTSHGELFELSVDDFSRSYLSKLQEGDCVIVVSIQGALVWYTMPQ